MLENFEKQTAPMTQEERKLVQPIIKLLKKYKKSNPVKSNNLCYVINARICAKKFDNYIINGVRLRRIVNHIRTNALLPVIATNRGYYVSEDKVEIRKQIKSLYQRAYSIRMCAEGLTKHLNSKP